MQSEANPQNQPEHPTNLAAPRTGTILEKLRTLFSATRLGIRSFFGNTLNLLRLPGFVRQCDYKASIGNASVSVHTHDLFTVITVNGLDVYFHRLTGMIDGVGFSPAAGCRVDEAPESERPALRHAG